MNIIINNLPYKLTDEQEAILMSLLHGKLVEEYARLEPTWRLAAKAVARGALSWIEERVRQSSGIEVARQVRPGKGVDPVPHLALIGSRLLSDMATHVVISFETAIASGETSASGTLENFAVRITPKDSGENGGSVDSHGHIGVRQDDGTQISGSALQPPVSDRPALYIGLKT
jgi:hypothetical protein